MLLAPDGPERPALEATGATFLPLQHLRRKGLNPLRDLALALELFRRYRQQGVKLALHFTIKPVIYGSFAAHRAGVRNVSTLTGLGYTFLAGKRTNRIVRLLYRLALRHAETVLFHNPDDRALFIRDGLAAANRCAVVPGSGIRLADFPLTTYDEAVTGQFLFVGRLLTDKGIREYVGAARQARASNPELQFHVLGPLDAGNPAGITARELAAWTEEGTIIYAGETDDVRPYLRRASVVVLPSYREGCPRVLLEAAASGRALIGTDVAGVREVVQPEQNGWLVPPKSASQLAKACLRAAAAQDRLEEMGAAGHALVAARFSEAAVIAVYLQAAKPRAAGNGRKEE